ncbi:MAG: TolC family protein [Spirochaetales bacterium]|nr:TolC family protein [Spirochaetales bacterium]
MKNRHIPIYFILFALPFTLYCQSEEMVLTADRAVELALQNSLTVGTEELNLVIKERLRNTWWNVLYPRVTAGASLSRLHEQTSSIDYLIPSSEVFPGTYDYVTPISVDIPHTFMLGTSLNASLMLSAQMIYGIRQVYIDYDSGVLSLETARKKLERDVRKSFYNLLLLNENVKLLIKNMGTAKTRYDISTANYKAGLVDEYTMLAAQVGFENMKPALEELKNGYTSALLAFKMSIGIPFDQPVTLSGTIDPEMIELDTQKLVASFLHNRLDIQTLQNTITLLENVKELSVSSLYPMLTLMLSYDPYFAKDPFAYNWFEDMSNDWHQRSGMFSVGISISLDAFLPFSRTQTDIANAQTNIDKTRLALRQATQGAEMEIRTLILKLKKSRDSLKILQLNLSLAEKANSMGQQAYKAGLKDYSQIESTELELQKAQFEILKEKFNYATGLLDLAYALNANMEKIKEVSHE